MDYYSRHIEAALRRAVESFPVVLLTGPRQVGKTTLLEHLREEGRRYVTLDDIVVRSQAREDPALFIRQYPPPVLIDEIQYAPDLLSYVKMEVDRRKQNNLYWLTGSQQFHLMANVTESLAGRVAIVNLLGMSWREKEKLPGPDAPALLDAAGPTGAAVRQGTPEELFGTIWQGGFPALVSGVSGDWELYYRSYLQTYVQRDVRDLKNIGDLEQFTRFLRSCAARTSQVLNLSDLADDVDVSVKTIKSWLSVLEASYQIYILRPHFDNRLKRLIKAPKLYFLDTGFCCYLTGWLQPEALQHGAMAGPMFETFVIGELLKRYWNHLKEAPLRYYRDREKREIDLLVETEREIYPIEVKLGATPRSEWIDAFGCIRGYARGGVVCQADSIREIRNRVHVLPWTVL